MIILIAYEALGTSDFYGLPEFFIDTVRSESAGNGNVRLLVYTKRQGGLVPLYSAVMNSVDLLLCCRSMTEAATEEFNNEAMRGAVH